MNFAIPEAWADLSRRHHFARDYARRRFAEWCASQRIVFADAIDDLQQHYLDSGRRRESLLASVDSHDNAGGQRVIANVFARVIEQERLIGEIPDVAGAR